MKLRAVLVLALSAAFVMGLEVGVGGQRLATHARSDAGRSTLIYPPERIALRMDHSLSAHRELECTRCHTDAGTSTRSSDLLLPHESSCAPCHDAQLDRANPSDATCGTCHVGVRIQDGARAPVIPVSVTPTPRLTFSHAQHASQPCVECHTDIGGVRVATRANLPTMRDCFRCHAPRGLGEGISPRPLECESCHLATGSGQLVTSFPEGAMNPPAWMAGMRHDHEWLTRHRWVAADSGPLCAECHSERECADCHDGRVRMRRVHPGDWLTTHPVSARRDQPRCSSCHTVSQFCAECHGRLGIAPLSAPDVRASERWHPPSAVWIYGPNMHAREAVRSLQSCASCHAEDDCVACHGSRGVAGAGLSPHPPGFARSCRSALESNARACVTCHGDIEDLRARCR
jgi:Cytochrome c7 and related cytochrome c